MTATIADEALRRLDDAKARRLYLLERWEELGRPVLSSGERAAHPLLKAINDIDIVCVRLEREIVGIARAGRPAGAVSAPDRKAPARVRKLRSV